MIQRQCSSKGDGKEMVNVWAQPHQSFYYNILWYMPWITPSSMVQQDIVTREPSFFEQFRLDGLWWCIVIRFISKLPCSHPSAQHWLHKPLSLFFWHHLISKLTRLSTNQHSNQASMWHRQTFVANDWRFIYSWLWISPPATKQHIIIVSPVRP